MSLTDPMNISFDEDVTDTPIPRTMSEGRKSIYETEDGNTIITVSHQINKNSTRHLMRLDRLAVAEDPLTAVAAEKKLSVYLVIEEPNFGFTDVEILGIIHALLFKLNRNMFDGTMLSNLLSNQH